LFWALHPTRSWDEEKHETYHQYKRILLQLKIIFKELGADKRAIDATRVSRIYGSRNHKSQTLVALWQRTDANGNMARYTIDELEDFFGTRSYKHLEFFAKREYSSSDSIVLDWKRPKNQELDGQQEPTEHRKNLGYIGRLTRFERDLERFWALAEVVRQKRIKKGTRFTHVGILAAILRWVLIYREYNANQQAKAIKDAAVRLRKSFEDPASYELSTIKEQLVSLIQTQLDEENPYIRHNKIGELLELTTDEARLLADLVPGSRKDQFWPPAPDQAPFRLKPTPRAEQQQARRDYLVRWYAGKHQPDSRTLAAEITKATGFDCSHVTALKDWQAVFPSTEPEHRQLYLLDDDVE
jgi:hypothetical protein